LLGSEQILRARAAVLAEPQAESDSRSETLDLLTFSLGSERFAVEMSQVNGVSALGALSTIPCTPGFIAGLANYRGRALPVLDLRFFLDRPIDGLPDPASVLAVELEGVLFGIVCEEIGSASVAVDEIAPPLARSGIAANWIRGVTPGLVSLLDLPNIARSPQILVDEEPA